MSAPAPNILTNNNKEETEPETLNNKNNIRERVRQRKTSYTNNKYNNIVKRLRQLRTHVLNFRVSEEELEKIITIMEKRGLNTISQVLREAVDIYYGLLSGAKQVATGNIIIQNPIVNIVKAEAEAKAESKTEINIDIDSVLNEIRKLRQLISTWARMRKIPPAAYDTASNLIKAIEKQLKAVN